MPRERSLPSAPTLVDVAKEAGVSLATASRALNGSSRKVADSYRERVLAAAARLSYSPNLQAQAVARGRTSSVALVVSDITDPYFSMIAAGVFRAAERAGLIVTMSVSERRPDRELQIVKELRRQQRPAVLVLVGSRQVGDEAGGRLARELEAFEGEGGRVALVSQEGWPFDTVALENREAAEELSRSMVGLGYARFAILAGPAGLVVARDRVEGFRSGLRTQDIEVPDSNILFSDFTRDGGYAAAGEYLSRDLGAEILLVVNDVMAVGAMARFREAGLDLPSDLAVTGFDDISTLRDVSPSLTTVRVPLYKLGEAAVGLALATERSRPRVHRVGGEVVIRQSTPGVDAMERAFPGVLGPLA